MKAQRQRADRRGREAEDRAASWLEEQGWLILDRRRKTPLGEIDLICRDGETTVFVEVKWRKSEAALDLAIDAARLARVVAAAEAAAHEYVGESGDLRVDVVLIAPGVPPRHIRNATVE